MICTICLCYLISNVPGVILKVSDAASDFPTLAFICDNIFWMQYTLNFGVYAASNKQYREAYLLFLNEGLFCCFPEGESGDHSSGDNHADQIPEWNAVPELVRT